MQIHKQQTKEVSFAYAYVSIIASVAGSSVGQRIEEEPARKP
jgi:hypothetical protein